MPHDQSYSLRICKTFYNFLSYITAGIHYGILNAGFLKVPSYLLNTSSGVYKTLRNIWCARIFRSMLSILVRSPLRKSMLRLVNFSVPLPANTGCIIVICHTPWQRLLVQWCLENNFGLIIASGNWTNEKKPLQRQGKGFREMRDIVKYLQQNGRIIIAADTFNNLSNCPVKFLGNYLNASLLPARLANVAQVPLVVAIPVLDDGAIHFNAGPKIECKMLRIGIPVIIQNLVSFLETEIIKNPSIWPLYVK